ncbi:magnesium and cobalt transport protein CorA [Novosphingobium sp. TH158]|uniref:magnesium and cobalt transport protein CorA n=1 Tax=Novosphingobium sp. TH158 TaxID=2067455 RepID=UPI000C7A413F|nr:magnesium and cobalt transport protein CorA [Novosphingobium sp. TH158]PLK24441.1 magnesium transporter [Novosphingobium sp. TH158]
MAIIASRRYVKGKPSVTALPIDGVPRKDLGRGQFDWIGLAEPDAAELQAVATQFELHPLAVEDALNPQQLPKVEVYPRHLFIVARTASMDEGETISYGQTALFLSRDFLITVRFGSNRAHNALRDRLESDAQRLAEGPDFVAHAILDFIVDGFQPLIDKLEDAVQTMEERAIHTFPEQSTIRRIFRLRRQLRRFERVVGPMEEVCDRLARTVLPFIDNSAQVWFRDVQDHMHRTLARMRGLKETLASIVETASLLEAHRQGEMTRKLAAWAAILAVPTAIAGIYGMNFDVMPELRWRYGYPLVLGVIGLICGGLWLRFRRIDWL